MNLARLLYEVIGRFPTTPVEASTALAALDATPIPEATVLAASDEEQEWLGAMIQQIIEMSLRARQAV